MRNALWFRTMKTKNLLGYSRLIISSSRKIRVRTIVFCHGGPPIVRLQGVAKFPGVPSFCRSPVHRPGEYTKICFLVGVKQYLVG